MKQVNIRMIEDQEESEVNDVEISAEQEKAYLFKYYPDLYKQMYPDEVVTQKQSVVGIPTQPSSSGDISKSDKVYKFDRYGQSNISDSESFNYKITITTDMNIDD